MRNPAPPEPKKPAQSPLERIEHAIMRSQSSAFARALDELWCSKDEFGNWPHRVLRLLMDMSFGTPAECERQQEWVEQLLQGPVPPRPTDNETFLALAFKKRAYHLVAPLRRAGFSADPGVMLQGLLDMPTIDPDIQVQQLQSLLSGSNTPKAKDHRHFVEQVIARGAFHLLPGLHRVGFEIQTSPDYEKKMAAALGRGEWSFPELVMPKLMEGTPARDAFCSALSVSLVGKDGKKGFLQAEHVERFCALHIPKRISLRANIHNAIHSFGLKNPEATPTYETTRALLALQKACLIDVGKIMRGNTHSPAVLRLMEPVVAQMEFDAIETRTNQSTATARPRRI